MLRNEASKVDRRMATEIKCFRSDDICTDCMQAKEQTDCNYRASMNGSQSKWRQCDAKSELGAPWRQCRAITSTCDNAPFCLPTELISTHRGFRRLRDRRQYVSLQSSAMAFISPRIISMF